MSPINIAAPFSTSQVDFQRVTGFLNGAPVLFPFPPIEPPGVALGGALSVPKSGTRTIPSGTHGFTSLTIEKGATLRVEGPAQIVVEDFTGDMNGRLEIDATAGPVTIFCSDSYTHINGFESIPAPGSPMAVAFFIEGTNDVTFPSNTPVRGGYNVPNAGINFSADNEAWGAFTGKRVSMNSGTKFHFDETLLEHWAYEGNDGGDVTILAWFDAPVLPALAADRRDPLTVLNLSKADLVQPEKAWDWGANSP